MGSIERRLEALEGSARERSFARRRLERPEHREAKARMSAYLDEIAAARREGREPHEEAVAVMEAIQRRRELRYGA